MAEREGSSTGETSSTRETPPARATFSTRLATLLTMAGVAIGLGNVWRFPYMMGRYGGSAFLLVYLLFTIAFAVPALMAEWALGRHTGRGPMGAFTAALGPLGGRIVGSLLLITVLVADSYYLVVIANIVYTAWFSMARGFGPAALPAFEAGLARGGLQYAISVALLALTLFVIHRGLRCGIEATSRIFVPFFGIVEVLLVISTLALPGALEQFARFLRPDLSRLGAAEIFAALGQAFFSLGLGGTFMLAYGSYLRDRESIPRAALATGLADAGASLLASLFIVPAVLVFGLDMAAGPQLIFATFPRLFEAIPGGLLLGSLFLLALILMAFLSNVAALEVFVAGCAEIAPLRLGRNGIIAATLVIETLLMLPSALHPPLVAWLDLIFGSGMQVLGSALAVVALTWGLGRAATLGQIFGESPRGWRSACFHWLRFVVPGALLAILLGYIHSKIR
jgi:NSS family neurotransmitter:Na+ symporter